jgi:peptidyl-tRNA hydrolase, PTH1 family
MSIKLIVGLGNPGPDYDQTRHNAGAWVVEAIAHDHNVELRPEQKFHGLCGKVSLQHSIVWLLLPKTFMNHSGQSVKALADFYKIQPDDILVAHDELDLPVGCARLKTGGGHGGHNGLRDITAHLGSANFHRLRIGISHPGDKNRVLDFVLGRPSKSDKIEIDQSIDAALQVLPLVVEGQISRAMTMLHTN